VPGAFASLLAQERDTLSCRATAGILMPAIMAAAIMYRLSIRASSFGQAWRPAASAGYGVVSHLQLIAEREKR
jgi:hypothetical protein